MQRRSFLMGMLTLAAAPVLPVMAQPILGMEPIIWGDGHQDDWAGLQTMLDGLPFRVENEFMVASESSISNGTIVLSRTLTVDRRHQGFFMTNCEVRTHRHWKGGAAVLRIREVPRFGLDDVRIVDSRSIIGGVGVKIDRADLTDLQPTLPALTF